MKKNFNSITGGIVAAFAAFIFMSAMPAEGVITKDNGVTVINTTSLDKNVRGFRGATPVKIYVKGNKIERIEALKNQETPKFFAKAKQILNSFNGISVSKASKMNVDGVTGATFSSKALKENIKLGLDYYKKNK
nr:FMN-binding protein [Prevotella sp.]